MDQLLEVTNLSTQFKTEEKIAFAVRQVNLSIKPGETIGIVGESGSGKSVTARSIMRIVENQGGQITSGEILLEGDDLVKKTEKQMRNIRGNMISMIFQDPMTSLNPLIKVGEQIAEVLRYHKNYSKQQARAETIRIMQDMSIPSAEKRYGQYPHEFSGGMLQRLMIAIALACKPKLLIADEPTTALDVTIQAQILRLMKQLQTQYNMSILLITHDLGVVAQVCDRVSVMYAGEIVESADVATLFEEPLHPYTWGLIESIPRLGQRKGSLQPIQGAPPKLTEEMIGCSFAKRCPYKSTRCEQQKPVLERLRPAHAVACHHADELVKRKGDPGWKNYSRLSN
ncbi:ABC transporter ATP-binding protein [Brevibacillus reuszeri]|uniref:ABC transporter ATP-binding protein n=1 Tax=Brevibacillus reuszeri TaxID=54915 RepID=A0A0K9YQW2_9BACL|nr:ABC transporter ATP-binding protein [Brevibacillus reuszeri]KNB70570.1 peptide ABC transporter ATP-binding protein [Brevibacillus reuszeri]MED1861459.1 ABC transporter ATP-binding protein [Brevibacillus reuszeri]GED70005.1 ABC transporter ATP-binding protein [Brevibacillus reuszeri]